MRPPHVDIPGSNIHRKFGTSSFFTKMFQTLGIPSHPLLRRSRREIRRLSQFMKSGSHFRSCARGSQTFTLTLNPILQEKCSYLYMAEEETKTQESSVACPRTQLARSRRFYSRCWSLFSFSLIITLILNIFHFINQTKGNLNIHFCYIHKKSLLEFTSNCSYCLKKLLYEYHFHFYFAQYSADI